MTSNDNTVNIEIAKPRYHHGDLRAALIEAGLRELANGDAGDLSLRAIARAVGVSATAVYRHFADKEALLNALCREGDARLAEASRVAQARAGGGRAGFEATGHAYVRFALDNPALFRLTMTRMAAVSGSGNLDRPGHLDRPSEGMALLLANVAAQASPDASAAEQRTMALYSWALVHGLAVLMLDGLVPADDALIDAVIASPGPGLTT